MTNYELHDGEAIEIMQAMPDNNVDMALLDLPFETTQNEWDKLIPVQPMWEQLRRLVKPHGAIVCFAQDPFSSLLVASHFVGYKHKWVWSKKQSGNFAVAKHQPLSVTEDVLVFTGRGERANYYPIMRKGKLRYRGSKKSTKHGRGFGGMKQVYYQSDEYYPTNLLEFAAVARQHSLHPSQKPVELLRYLIETYSLPGDTVLDISMGSGSTVIAAIDAERRAIGIEKNADIFATAQKRIHEHTQALPLFAG